MEKFKFTPESGFRDGTAYPNPTRGEVEVREQFQRPLDQLRDYVNQLLGIIPTDEELQQMVVNHDAIQKLREDLEYLEEHSNSYAEYDENTGNLQINTVKEVNVTLAGLNELTTQLKNSITQLSNSNLLINSDFRNPVNQRGYAIYVGTDNAWNYTIDRWRTQGASLQVKVSETELILTNSSSNSWYFMQKLEKSLPIDNYTFSLNVKSISGDCLIAMEDINGVTIMSKPVTSKGSVNLTGYGAVCGVVFEVKANSSISIEWCKLEQGSIATPFVSRLYGEELALCQRYYQVFSPNTTTYHRATIVNNVNQGVSMADIVLPCEMRTSPTVVGTINAIALNNNVFYATANGHGQTPSIIRLVADTSEDCIFSVQDILLDAEIY